MRFFTTIVATLVASVVAQTSSSQYNAINTPPSGFDTTAGQPITITWANPSSGTVTIRLTQGGSVAPGEGIELASGIPASAGTATFTLPEASDVNNSQYNFEIVDDSNPTQPNFSSPFVVDGATGSSAYPTTSGASSSVTATSSGMTTMTSSSSATETSSSSSSASSASSSSSASRTATSSSSSTSETAATTSAPSSNVAGLSSYSGLVVAIAGLIAVF